MSKPRICEGSCEQHTGEIRQVDVRNKNHEWGTFFYCETAIAEDLTRGLKVTVLPPTPPEPKP